MRTIYTFLLGAILTFSCAACATNTASARASIVGMTRLELHDPIRLNWDMTGPRPLTTTLWYPTDDETEMIRIDIPKSPPSIFTGGLASPGASISLSKQTYPLIVMSHGTGGAAFQMMWLGRELAANGYIVAAVDHHGNTAAEDSFDPRGFHMPWERAQDLSSVLDLLLDDPAWAPHIDNDKIGAVGFSLGGYTVTALAGGRLDLQQFRAFCRSEASDATCDPQSEYPTSRADFEAILKTDPTLADRMEQHSNSFKDERIRTVVAIAPALGQGFTTSSLSEIDLPYVSIVGDLDVIAPARSNADRINAHIPSATGHIIQGANHYAFLNQCLHPAADKVPVCKASPNGISREMAHTQAQRITLNFLQENLKNQ